jgi:hypothetical protein
MFIACTETNVFYQIYYRYLSQITNRQVTSIFRNIGVYSKDEFNFNVYQSNVISVRITTAYKDAFRELNNKKKDTWEDFHMTEAMTNRKWTETNYQL